MVRIVVSSGDVDRGRRLVSVPMAAPDVERHLRPVPWSGSDGVSMCVLRAAADHDVVAQYDHQRQELLFVLPTPIASGGSLVLEPAMPTDGDHGSETVPAHPVSIDVGIDGVRISVGGERFLTYTYAGTRRPYFWPVLGPAGASVVRGQGSAEHPHHTGLAVNYGGHSEGGSANIWSDWDEPPYGPGGRMIHRELRRVANGPVVGEVVHDLTYVDAHGAAVVEETRTIRFWWAGPGARVLDIDCEIHSVIDGGPRPFLITARLPADFGIPGTGRIANSAGTPAPLENGHHGEYHASWVDASGPTGAPPPPPPVDRPELLIDMGVMTWDPEPRAAEGPWNGIAFIDHPGNEPYPGLAGRYAVAPQLTLAHYPPVARPDGPFTIRHRVLVHDGDAVAAGVDSWAADYANPCAVAVDVTGVGGESARR